MPTEQEYVGELGNQSLEGNIIESFRDFNLDENQTKRLITCIEKKIKQDNEIKNEQLKLKRIIKKFKKIIEGEINTEEGLIKIESEIKELETGGIDIKELNTGAINNAHEHLKDEISATEKETSATEKETSATEKETSATEKETSATEKEASTTEKEASTTEKEKETIEQEIEVGELLKELYTSYENIDNNYKPTNEELAQKKDSLPEETKKKLAENNISEEQYLQYSIAREKIYELGSNDQSRETRDFLKNLRNLENKLGITNIQEKGLPQTYNQEIINDNSALKEIRDNNAHIQKLNNISILGNSEIQENLDFSSPEKIKEIIINALNFDKFANDDPDYPKDSRFQALRQLISGITDFSNLSDENKKYITEFINEINKFKKQFNQSFNNYIKGYATQAPILGIMGYLNEYTNTTEDSFANRIEKNGSGEIGKEKNYITCNGNILQINGIIDGNPITFYYNLDGTNNTLSCDDTLHYDKEKKTYKIHEEGQNPTTSDLNIQLPSIEDIVTNLERIKPEDYQTMMEKSNSIKDFYSTVHEQITKNIKSNYPDNNLVKVRLTRFTEKNLTTQECQNTFIPQQDKQEIIRRINQEGEKNQKLKNILALIDNTTENNTTSDLQILKNCFKKIQELTDNSQESLRKLSEIKDPTLKKLLSDLQKAKEPPVNYERRETAFIQFFDLFVRDGRSPETQEFSINIDDMEQFLSFSDGGNYIPFYTTEFQNKKGKIDQELLKEKEGESNPLIEIQLTEIEKEIKEIEETEN